MSSGHAGTRTRARARSGPSRVLAALELTALLLSCGGERAALLRGQSYYDDNQYERALSVWRDLERHEPELTVSQFARYAYLRGMTDYRLGFHADARHWLGLAKVTEQANPGGLDSAWVSRLDGALADLDRETFGIPDGNTDAVQSIDAPAAGPPAAPAPGGHAPPGSSLPRAPAPPPAGTP